MSKDSPARVAARLHIVREVLEEYLGVGDALSAAVSNAIDPDMSDAGASVLRGAIRDLVCPFRGVPRLLVLRAVTLDAWNRLTSELMIAVPYIEWQRAVLRFHAVLEQAWEAEGGVLDFDKWCDGLRRARGELEGFDSMIFTTLATILPTIKRKAKKGRPGHPPEVKAAVVDLATSYGRDWKEVARRMNELHPRPGKKWSVDQLRKIFSSAKPDESGV